MYIIDAHFHLRCKVNGKKKKNTKVLVENDLSLA